MSEERTLTIDEALPPRKRGNRFKVAWWALRGRSIMYRVAVQFERSPDFISSNGLTTECLFHSKDNSVPSFNGVPFREIIGRNNRSHGWDPPWPGDEDYGG